MVPEWRGGFVLSWSYATRAISWWMSDMWWKDTLEQHVGGSPRDPDDEKVTSTPIDLVHDQLLWWREGKQELVDIPEWLEHTVTLKCLISSRGHPPASGIQDCSLSKKPSTSHAKPPPTSTFKV